jgi:hemolysin III
MTSGLGASPRPRLRGVLHRWAVPIAVALSVAVVLRARSAGGRAALIVYGSCTTVMLAVSAVYHSPGLVDARWRWLLRRLDHAAILLAIAGAYTAVIVFALDGTTQVVLLIVAWAIALAGVAIRMLWIDAPAGLVAAVYLVAGWMALLDIPAFARGLSGVELGFIVAGGVAYTVGAVVFALKRPNPWPATFGYHEVFHAFVVVGALSHWTAIFLLAGG